jgi:hypothetical protein
MSCAALGRAQGFAPEQDFRTPLPGVVWACGPYGIPLDENQACSQNLGPRRLCFPFAPVPPLRPVRGA